MEFALTVAPLLAGWILDRLLGDPSWLPHPVVGFGSCIRFFEKRFNKGRRRVLKGAVSAFVLIAGVYGLVWLLLRLTACIPWLHAGLSALLIFYCLAGTTLAKEVGQVFAAVGRSLADGRRQVGRIVGRDTAQLSAVEVRTAALETLAENLSDGVVAPLFWYALLGVPGMMAYKMVNTLDSMVGYRTERYRDFGKAAAKADDAANFIPARLTALLMLLVSFRLDRLPFVRRFGPMHASPNSGYPEAALAGILDCRFGGAHDYFGTRVDKPFIGTNERDFTPADVEKAVSVNRRTEVCMLILSGAVRCLFL